jgi:hypothetical protein
MSKSKKNTSKAATTGGMNDANIGNIKATSIQPLQPQANFANYSNLGKPFPDNVSLSSQTSQKLATGKKGKKIDKSQISGPTGFRVVQHVGLTTNNNFEVQNYFLIKLLSLFLSVK